MSVEGYEWHQLVKLESAQILPTALPRTLWDGVGSLLLDVGDGHGTRNWVGATFGEIQMGHPTNVQRTAEGIPRRLTVAVAIDESRADIQGAVLGTDHGPLTATIYAIVREKAGASLPQYQFGAFQIPNRDPEPTLTLPQSGTRQFLFIGSNTFKFALPVGDREQLRDLLVEGNQIDYETTTPLTIFYASVATGTDLDIWTVTVDDSYNFAEDSDLAFNLRFFDPPKSQDWQFVQDREGNALVVRGRTGQMNYGNGIWSFEIENRVHDADRLLVDIWSDSVQQANYSGDRFFEFTASIEAGLDFSWPN